MSRNVTHLLIQLSQENRRVVDEIFLLVYDELKRMAGLFKKREGRTHAAIDCAGSRSVSEINRPNARFAAKPRAFSGSCDTGPAADCVRPRAAWKSVSAGQSSFNLTKILIRRSSRAANCSRSSARSAVPPRSMCGSPDWSSFFFSGALTFEETAKVMGISLRTAMRHRQLARAWLYRKLNRT